jgi:hypothetical protein
MNFNNILKEMILPDKDLPKWNYEDIAECLISDSPEDDLLELFKTDWYPKVYRWLENKFKDVKPDEEWLKKKRNKFQAKLKTYLESNSDRFVDNAKTLGREIISAYKDWSEYEVKMINLPKPKL